MNRILRGQLGGVAIFMIGTAAGAALMLAAIAEWWFMWRRDWASWPERGYEANS